MMGPRLSPDGRRIHQWRGVEYVEVPLDGAPDVHRFMGTMRAEMGEAEFHRFLERQGMAEREVVDASGRVVAKFYGRRDQA